MNKRMSEIFRGIRQRHRNMTVGVRRRQKEREYLASKKKGPCTDCGGRFNTWQMDFDHVRGRKVFNVSQIWGRNLAVVDKEIAKCDLVCANCHRDRTYRRSHESVA